MDKDTLSTYSVKQLKNIISTHNASEKINIIKAYGKMKKAELVKAITQQIKQERLMTIVKSLKLSNAGKVNELFTMMEEGGSNMKEKVKKSVSVKPPSKKPVEKQTFYERVVELNRKSSKYLDLLTRPVFRRERDNSNIKYLLTTELGYVGYIPSKSNNYKGNLYITAVKTGSSKDFVTSILEIYYDEVHSTLKGGTRTKELNKELKDVMYYSWQGITSDIRNVFSRISVEGQQKIYQQYSRYMIKIPNEYTEQEKEEALDFYIKGIVRPTSE